jgi:hypothetical protein
MPLGPHVPAWQALRDELQGLIDETSAVLAMVTDESNVVWCWSKIEKGHFLWRASTDEVGAAVASLAGIFHGEQVANLSPPLRRGGRLDVIHRDPHWRTARSYEAHSFAGIYILLVLFNEPPSAAELRIRAALPKIEALTLALPPPDGPDATLGAGKMRA